MARPKTESESAKPTTVGVSVFDKDTQYALRRKAILKEAARGFETDGPQGFSMTALATRLNITTPALYYYFKSKQEMLFECYRASLNIAELALDRAEEEGGCPAKVLETFIHRYLVEGFIEVRPTMALRDHITLNQKFQDLLIKQREALHMRLRAVVSDGIKLGVIVPCNAKLMVSSITGMTAMVIRAYDPAGELSGEDVATQTVRLLTGGFRVVPPQHDGQRATDGR